MSALTLSDIAKSIYWELKKLNDREWISYCNQNQMDKILSFDNIIQEIILRTKMSQSSLSLYLKMSPQSSATLPVVTHKKQKKKISRRKDCDVGWKI